MAINADVHVPHGSSHGTIQADKVLKSHIGETLMKAAVVAGGAAGNFTVTGIATADALVAVILHTGAGTDVTDISDLTSEFTITAANTINNTGGTASSGGKLLVFYQDNT